MTNGKRPSEQVENVYFSWINLIHTPIKDKIKETPESSKWFYSSL